MHDALLKCVVLQEELSSQSRVVSSRSNIIRKMTVSGRNLSYQHSAQDKAVRNQMWSKDKKIFNIECYIRTDTSQGMKVCTKRGEQNKLDLNHC